MLLKVLIHLKRGVPLSSIFRSGVTTSTEDDKTTVTLGKAAIFLNYLGLKKELDQAPAGKTIALDFSSTHLIDHSVLENLHQFESDYTRAGGKFLYEGLDDLKPLSSHPYAARKRG